MLPVVISSISASSCNEQKKKKIYKVIVRDSQDPVSPSSRDEVTWERGREMAFDMGIKA